MSKWKEVILEEVCTIRRGMSPRPIHDYLQKEGVPWVKIADATAIESRFLKNTKEFIRQDGIQKSLYVEPGNIILSNSGTPGLPKIMATDGCVHDGWLVLNSFQNISRDFLYYKLLHMRSFLISQANGSVYQNLKTGIVKKIKISIPPLEQQKEIAQFLCSLDDKIDLNNKMNETLKEQALSIYKEIISSHQYKTAQLQDICKIMMGQSPRGVVYNNTGQGYPFFQGRADFGWRFPQPRVFTQSPVRMAYKNDLLLSVRAPVGGVNIVQNTCAIGRGLAKLTPKSEYRSYLYYTLLFLEKDLDKFNSDGTVFGSIRRGALESLAVPLVSEQMRDVFEKTVRPIDQLIEKNYKENECLKELRDNFLPEVMAKRIV